MRHSDSTRPVSGEIMMPDRTGRAPRPAEQPCDVVDVDFETVHPLVDEPVAWRPEAAPRKRVSGLDMLKADEQGGMHLRTRGTPLFWGLGAALVVASFWVAGGHSLVPAGGVGVYGAASQPLQLIDVTSRVEREGAHSMLIVDGTAWNRSVSVVTVPAISINVLSQNGSTTRYFLGTNNGHLGPGARFPFSSRLVAPREGVKSVSVTFRAS